MGVEQCLAIQAKRKGENNLKHNKKKISLKLAKPTILKLGQVLLRVVKL